MENIKTISIRNNGMPIIGRYNGSYHPIEHTSSDDRDYSITIWEWYYACVENLFEDVEEEDFTEEMQLEAWELTLEQFADFGVEINN